MSNLHHTTASKWDSNGYQPNRNETVSLAASGALDWSLGGMGCICVEMPASPTAMGLETLATTGIGDDLKTGG